MKSEKSTKTLYYIAISLFSALFIGSAVLTVADREGSYAIFRHLEFPEWLLYPLTFAKLLGLAAILKSPYRGLKDFAFAGFLYDLLLAFGGHLAQKEIDVLLPIFGIVLWIFAFVMDRKYYRH
jgi:hypothetical protein